VSWRSGGAAVTAATVVIVMCEVEDEKVSTEKAP
jgi:hypothetical protein